MRWFTRFAVLTSLFLIGGVGCEKKQSTYQSSTEPSKPPPNWGKPTGGEKKPPPPPPKLQPLPP